METPTITGSHWVEELVEFLRTQPGVSAVRPKLPFVTDDIPLFLGLGVLAAPTFVVLGLLGSVLILIGRKKKPLIGYDR